MREPRPKIPHKVQLDIVFRDHGCCCLCFNVILADEPRILEHLTPRKMFKNPTDADVPKNLGWAHKVCADLKTRGCTGTSKKGSVADGDTHKIAKAKRHEKARVEIERVPPEPYVPPKATGLDDIRLTAIGSIKFSDKAVFAVDRGGVIINDPLTKRWTLQANKLQGRGFDKTRTKKMRTGEVVKRKPKGSTRGG